MTHCGDDPNLLPAVTNSPVVVVCCIEDGSPARVDRGTVGHVDRVNFAATDSRWAGCRHVRECVPGAEVGERKARRDGRQARTAHLTEAGDEPSNWVVGGQFDWRRLTVALGQLLLTQYIRNLSKHNLQPTNQSSQLITDKVYC